MWLKTLGVRNCLREELLPKILPKSYAYGTFVLPDYNFVPFAKNSLATNLLFVKTGRLRRHSETGETQVIELLRKVWEDSEGQDVAEYAVMLAVILIIVIGTVKLIGGKSNNVFSEVASSIGS
jgi:Flp pilus assembly pilin Flp